jgi:hypothetical protein
MNQQQEDFITKMSYASAIADDELRPAYAKIVRVTKDATKAQKAFSLALDIAAGTGKDVGTVSQAMAKYLGGNTTALDKLVPGLKDAGDKMKYLQDTFGGAAKEVGDNSPFEKMKIILDDMSERLGGYLLPYVQQFVDWLSGPEAKTMIDDTFAGIQSFFDWLKSAKGQEMIQNIADAVKNLADGLANLGKWMSENKWVFDVIAKLSQVSSMIMGTVPNTINAIGNSSVGRNNMGSQLNGGMPQLYTPGQSPIQINLKLEGNVTGKSLVTELNKEAKRRGVTVGKMIQ